MPQRLHVSFHVRREAVVLSYYITLLTRAPLRRLTLHLTLHHPTTTSDLSPLSPPPPPPAPPHDCLSLCIVDLRLVAHFQNSKHKALHSVLLPTQSAPLLFDARRSLLTDEGPRGGVLLDDPLPLTVAAPALVFCGAVESIASLLACVLEESCVGDRGLTIHVFVLTFFGTGLTVGCTFQCGTYWKKINKYFFLFFNKVFIDYHTFCECLVLS